MIRHGHEIMIWHDMIYDMVWYDIDMTWCDTAYAYTSGRKQYANLIEMFIKMTGESVNIQFASHI